MAKASALFNSSRSQTLIKRVSPTEKQREFLQVSWNRLADHLTARLREQHGYPVTTWLQGSYKYGTLIKPVHANEEYDVDVGVYFEWKGDKDLEPPQTLRGWVQDELLRYKQSCEEVRSVEAPKDRCSRCSFERQFHIDTPVYHLDRRRDRRRLACLPNEWEPSDPKAFYKWFKNEVTGGDREQLLRMVRYFKAWAALTFDDAPGSRPSSVLLTVLVTRAYQPIRGFFAVDDDDALIAVIKNIHARLLKSRKVSNPAARGEELNRMSDQDWEGFIPRFAVLLDIANRAKAATTEVTAALVWSEAFSFLMPLPEFERVETFDEESDRILMQALEIEITVHAGIKQAVGQHRNQLFGVAADSYLVFRIANTHIIPSDAVVEWTVRNEGDEADAHSNLGHRQVGVRMLDAKIHAKFAGWHFMDCVVRVNGTVYAGRRVPINILDPRQPQAGVARSSDTKVRVPIKRQ